MSKSKGAQAKLRRPADGTDTTTAAKELQRSEVTPSTPRPWHSGLRALARRRSNASLSVASRSVLDRVVMSQAATSNPQINGSTDNSVVGGSGDDTLAQIDADGVDADDTESPEATTVKAMTPGLRSSLAFILVVIAALAAVGGWFGFQAYGAVQVQHQHARYLEAGKDAAVKLTTISYTDADAAVRRILDSATGQFSDDFRTRSQPFVAMVKQVQSTTVGTVAQAGLESVDGNKARVLVAVSVKTTLGTGGEQPVHIWRMRIDVQKVGNEPKVSNVEFVP